MFKIWILDVYAPVDGSVFTALRKQMDVLGVPMSKFVAMVSASASLDKAEDSFASAIRFVLHNSISYYLLARRPIEKNAVELYHTYFVFWLFESGY